MEMQSRIIDLDPDLPEVGKIKIGGKGEERKSSVGGTYRLPTKFDHFVVTGLERDALGNFKEDMPLMAALVSGYGTETKKKDGAIVKVLRTLPVSLLSDDIDDVFPTQYVAYLDRKRVAVSDGRVIKWFCDPKVAGYPALKEPIFAENKNNWVQTHKIDYRGKPIRFFKPHGTLHVQIRDEHAKFGGVYKFRTSSIITIKRTIGALQHIQTAFTHGFLRNVPLRMVVQTMEVNPEDVGSTDVHVVHVELDGNDVLALQTRLVETARLESKQTRQLEAARQLYLAAKSTPGDADETAEEQADVNEEFSHETIDATVVEVPAEVAPKSTTVQVQVPAGPAKVAVAKPAPSRDAAENALAQACIDAKTPEDVERCRVAFAAQKPAVEPATYGMLVGQLFEARRRVCGLPVPTTAAEVKAAEATPITAPAAPDAAPEETPEQRLRRSIAEAKTPADIDLAQKNLAAMKPVLDAGDYEMIAAEYFASREGVTGAAIPDSVKARRSKRTPPPPPPRAETPPAPAVPATPPTTPKKIDAKDIPWE